MDFLEAMKWCSVNGVVFGVTQASEVDFIFKAELGQISATYAFYSPENIMDAVWATASAVAEGWAFHAKHGMDGTL